VLGTLQDVQVPVLDKAKVVADLKQQGFSEALVLWMVSNLIPIEVGGPSASAAFTWNFDVVGALDLYEDYRRVDCWPLLCKPPKGIELNILRAERSDRWTDEMVAKLQDCQSKAIGNRQVCIKWYRLHYY
jgi:hypothetical protein